MVMNIVFKRLVAVGLSISMLCGCSMGDDLSGVPGESGKAVKHELLFHCGIHYTSFEGVEWKARPPIPGIPGYVNESNNGQAGSKNSIKGTMIRISETEAQFTTTDSPAGITILFDRTSDEFTACA